MCFNYHDNFHDPYSLTNILLKQTCVPIDLQDYASRSWWNAILKSLLPLRKMPNWRITFGRVLKNFLKEELIFYLQQVARNGKYTLIVHLEVCASIICISTSNWHWMFWFVRFWVSLIFSINVCLLNVSVSLFSISVTVIETNFTEYSKSDFIVWATSVYQFAHLGRIYDCSSEHY